MCALRRENKPEAGDYFPPVSETTASRSAGSVSFASRPIVATLPPNRAEEIVSLEQHCYPNPWSPVLIRAEFDKDISYRLGLIIDHRVAAYSFNYLLDQDLHLLNLAVAPHYQRRGLGKYLLCALISRAILRGVEFVSLEVRPSNSAALSLYGGLGFAQIGHRKNYYRNDGEDALVLELQCKCSDLKYLEVQSRKAIELFG